jgi:hypothetical protein
MKTNQRPEHGDAAPGNSERGRRDPERFEHRPFAGAGSGRAGLRGHLVAHDAERERARPLWRRGNNHFRFQAKKGRSPKRRRVA